MQGRSSAGPHAGQPGGYAAVVTQSEALLASGLFGAASDLLEEYLERSPDDGEALRTLGRVRMLQQRPHEAVILLQRALRAFRAAQPARAQNGAAPFPAANAEPVEADDIQFIDEQHQSTLRHRRAVSLDDSDTTASEATDGRGDGQISSVPEEIISEEVRVARDLGEALSNGHELPQGSHLGLEPLAVVPGEEGSIADPSAEELRVVEEVQEAFEAQPDIAEALTELGPFIDADESQTQEVDDSEAPGLDEEWLDTEPEGAEFDEAPTSLEMADVRTGQLSRAERARQVAIEVASKYGWDRGGREVLERVFNEYWWNAAKRAIERQLEAGLEPQELELALEARAIWHQRSEFWNSFPRDGFRYVNTYPFPYLPWPTALQVVRSFDGYADPDEIDHFLSELFERWYYDERLIGQYGSFLAYVKYRTQRQDGDLSLPGWCSFESDVSDAEENPYDEEAEAIQAEFRQKQDLFRLGVPMNGGEQRPDVPMLPSDDSNDDH